MPEAGIDLTRGWTHTVGNNLLGGSEVNVRYDFKGKNALVTGGATGIGRAACLAFAQAGAGVVVAGLGAAEGAAVVREIEEGGGKAIFVETDVRHERDIEAMMAAALSRFGRIDAAFNNAGIESSYGPLHELSTEEFDRIIAVNLRGIFLAMKHEIRHMLAAGGGTIVNTSSTAGITGMANIAAYTASKHGIIGLTKATALELGKSGIRVNAVAPGPVNTGLLAPHGGRQGRDPGDRREQSDGPHLRARGDRPGRAVPVVGRRRLHHRPHAGDRRRLHRAVGGSLTGPCGPTSPRQAGRGLSGLSTARTAFPAR